MTIATPKEFLTELFLGMTWDGPSSFPETSRRLVRSPSCTDNVLSSMKWPRAGTAP